MPAGTLELEYPHLAESARLYLWQHRFKELLDRWGSCQSTELSMDDLNSSTKEFVCIFIINIIFLLITDFNLLFWFIAIKGQI